MSVQTLVTLAQRPDLVARIPDVLASRWPVYLLAGRPGHGENLVDLLLSAPDNQIVLLAGEEPVGVGLSVPLAWDGTPGGLPAGWDGAVSASGALRAAGAAPNAFCAVSITIRPEVAGRDIGVDMIRALKRAAGAAGARALIGPVRPTHKHRYPLIPMADYARWRTPAGAVFDPWLRAHLAEGAAQLKVEEVSMTITGTVAQWEQWAGTAMPSSGRYLVPRALVPVEVDVSADLGTYREPNVWVSHPVA
jgi:GNAT superfamily N-acetyltransferase